MKNFRVLVGCILLIVAVSCKQENPKNYRPASIGQVNSLTVVIDNDLWQGKVGDKVRAHFAAPVLGLSSHEPLFTINQVPSSIFTGSIKSTRSVLYVEKRDTINASYIRTDLYARPQKVAVMIGKSEDDIIKSIEERADHVIAEFKNLELKESQKRFLRSLNKEPELKEKFGISMRVPSVYEVGKEEDNFIWMDRQILKGNMNIIAYTVPEDYFSNDSTFVSDIVKMRDSIGKKYIPGPDVPNKTTYMITEKAFAPYVLPAEIGGLKAVEVRGRWEIKNYPMAGPYLTYIINDKVNKRKLIIEGFTFAPAIAKREFMFELEAILKSININTEQLM